MSEPKFTLGPWEAVEIQEGHFHIHSPKEGRVNPVPVAVVDHHRDGYDPFRTVITPANAHLIAAAPEMYAALKFIAEREDYTFAECSLAEEIVGRAKFALAKAEGNSQ